MAATRSRGPRTCHGADIRDVQGKPGTLAAEHAFTLIELMLVLVIAGILTMLALPAYFTLKDRATDAANKSNVREIIGPIAAYYQDHQTYTGMTLAGLTAYDGGIDATKYTLAGITATTYCVQSPQGTGLHVYRKNGPTATIDKNHC